MKLLRSIPVFMLMFRSSLCRSDDQLTQEMPLSPGALLPILPGALLPGRGLMTHPAAAFPWAVSWTSRLLFGMGQRQRRAAWGDNSQSATFQGNTNFMMYQSIVDTGIGYYIKITVSDGSSNVRITLDYTGMVSFGRWNSDTSSWVVFNQFPSLRGLKLVEEENLFFALIFG
jgi:hypothetical protein